MMLSKEEEKIRRGVYVRINDNAESFIARIYDGPSFGKDSTFSIYKLELTAMIKRGRKQGVSSTPRPGSEVMLLRHGERSGLPRFGRRYSARQVGRST